MLGLVDYEDSDDEQHEQQREGKTPLQQQGFPSEPAAHRDPMATAHPAGPALPSAAELLSGGPAAAALPAAHAQQSLTGGKRSTPTSHFGSLPNPLASQPKVARSGGAASVAGGKPPQGVLLPPQLRGRANVATEDLASMFTRDAHKRLHVAKGNKGS
ncbi:hypothetical protein N2152v2_008320 [Parachlorella kessleri]